MTSAPNNPSRRLDIPDLQKLMPHRYPFLLIDRVTDYEDGRWLTAIKNVTFNEPYFPGHFPGLPTMPGVIILEGMAQACGVEAIRTTSVDELGAAVSRAVGQGKSLVAAIPVFYGDYRRLF